MSRILPIRLHAFVTCVLTTCLQFRFVSHLSQMLKIFAPVSIVGLFLFVASFSIFYKGDVFCTMHHCISTRLATGFATGGTEVNLGRASTSVPQKHAFGSDAITVFGICQGRKALWTQVRHPGQFICIDTYIHTYMHTQIHFLFSHVLCKRY